MNTGEDIFVVIFILIPISILYLAVLSYNLISKNLQNKIYNICAYFIHAVLLLSTVGGFLLSYFDKSNLGAPLIGYVIVLYPATLVCWILSLVLLKFVKLTELPKFIISMLPILPAIYGNLFFVQLFIFEFIYKGHKTIF